MTTSQAISSDISAWTGVPVHREVPHHALRKGVRKLDIFILAKKQAGMIDSLTRQNEQLKNEVARLKAVSSRPVAKPARNGNGKWTPERRATQSRRMREWWFLERATRPQPNGNGLTDY
jgi:hypothetical protein